MSKSGWPCISSGRRVRHVLAALKGGLSIRLTSCFLSFFMPQRFLQFVRQISTIMARPRVFFDMNVGGQPVGRIVMEVCTNLLEFEAFLYGHFTYFDGVLVSSVFCTALFLLLDEEPSATLTGFAGPFFFYLLLRQSFLFCCS